MKSSIILGLVCIIIGIVLAFLQWNGNDPLLTLNLIFGALIGLGVGLLIGSIAGYSSKASSVKKKQKEAAAAAATTSNTNNNSSIDNTTTDSSSAI